eukprot:45360_1
MELQKQVVVVKQSPQLQTYQDDSESEVKADTESEPDPNEQLQKQLNLQLPKRVALLQQPPQLHQADVIIDVADVDTDITDKAVAPNPMLKYGIIIFIILAVLLVCINFFVPKPKDLVETMTDAAASFTEPEVPEELPEADNSVLILTLSIVGGGLLGVAALIGGCYWAFVSGRLERYLPTLSEKARLAKEFFAKRKRDSDSGGAAAW